MEDACFRITMFIYHFCTKRIKNWEHFKKLKRSFDCNSISRIIVYTKITNMLLTVLQKFYGNKNGLFFKTTRVAKSVNLELSILKSAEYIIQNKLL